MAGFLTGIWRIAHKTQEGQQRAATANWYEMIIISLIPQMGDDFKEVGFYTHIKRQKPLNQIH